MKEVVVLVMTACPARKFVAKQFAHISLHLFYSSHSGWPPVAREDLLNKCSITECCALEEVREALHC